MSWGLAWASSQIQPQNKPVLFVNRIDFFSSVAWLRGGFSGILPSSLLYLPDLRTFSQGFGFHPPLLVFCPLVNKSRLLEPFTDLFFVSNEGLEAGTLLSNTRVKTGNHSKVFVSLLGLP